MQRQERDVPISLLNEQYPSGVYLAIAPARSVPGHPHWPAGGPTLAVRVLECASPSTLLSSSVRIALLVLINAPLMDDSITNLDDNSVSALTVMACTISEKNHTITIDLSSSSGFPTFPSDTNYMLKNSSLWEPWSVRSPNGSELVHVVHLQCF